jgi:D-alanyl-D-alanine dipeptidase
MELSGFTKIQNIPGICIDLRYATENNFLGRNLYGDFNIAYLHPEAFIKLRNAVQLLQIQKPRYNFLVFDALRPRKIQRVLFAAVEGTEQEIYLADPEHGSVHNFGFAVDLTVVDEHGRELDMGTGFAEFTLAAQPRCEEKMVAEGRLTSSHIQNRRLLRSGMEGAGFKGIPHEWWHYNALSLSELWANYTIVE